MIQFQILTMTDEDRKMRRAQRLSLLKDLVEKITKGEYEHEIIDPNQLYPLHDAVRKEFRHPSNWGGYNYGYMTSGESAQMGAGNKDPNM